MPHRPAEIIELHHVPWEDVRILLADDFEAWRVQVRSFLGSCGFVHIFEASDGLEAVEQALAINPDIAILDLGMPGLDGIEAAKQFRHLFPKSKVIILTQNSGEDLREAASKAGAVAFVLKTQMAEMAAKLIPAIRAALRTQR